MLPRRSLAMTVGQRTLGRSSGPPHQQTYSFDWHKSQSLRLYLCHSNSRLEAQRAAVDCYINGVAWKLVKEFVEVESGKNDDRPVLAQALKACRLYGAKLVIAKIDRLSRDAHFLLGLEKAGVDFVAAAERQSPDRRMISERTKAGGAGSRNEAIPPRRESSPFCEQNARKSHTGTVAFVSSFWLLCMSSEHFGRLLLFAALAFGMDVGRHTWECKRNRAVMRLGHRNIASTVRHTELAGFGRNGGFAPVSFPLFQGKCPNIAGICVS
jgi:hypothetical protein